MFSRFLFLKLFQMRPCFKINKNGIFIVINMTRNYVTFFNQMVCMTLNLTSHKSLDFCAGWHSLACLLFERLRRHLTEGIVRMGASGDANRGGT